LIGFFVNTLVLRGDLSGDPTFQRLLRRNRETALSAYDHQDLPFEKLVEALEPERSLSWTPLFQVMFLLQNDPPGAAPELGGLTLSSLRRTGGGTAKFDLTVAVAPGQGGSLSIQAEYSRDLFDASTASRLLGGFAELLEAVAEEPQRRLSELPLLTAPERQQLLEWNDTERIYREDGFCLHELLAAQVERSPDAVAVVFEEESLTYRELGRRSGRLARLLWSLGVGPEGRVGVAMERSLEMVVALLGILKAGAAYVPLDPSYPRERLAFLLEDALSGEAAPPVLLTQERLLDLLPALPVRPLCLEAGWSGNGDDLELPAPPEVLPDHPAYVIYTSGSTGRPKGVVNTHRAIVNRLLWMQEAYGLTGEDRVLQKTPFSFDVSVWEFFWPLLTGARLVMARPGGHQDPAYLVDRIAREGITTLHFVPSMLQVFLEAPDVERCVSLRRVVCSGEALPFELQQRFFARLPRGVELHNLYGPTEAAVDVTFWACRRDGSAPVPIGRPITNLRIHLLDAHLNPVPAGVPGELHIGGVGLARGYLGRPELTAEKLIPDPISGAPGARLYKSGDLARHRADGRIEYLGRIDHQVKIRGFRIELGEIESHLASHPAVREAVVLARGDGAAKGLTAYVVVGRDFQPSSLRAFLAEKLPAHMIPGGFVVLDTLPLTSNGKVDRKALARLEPEQEGAPMEAGSPRTAAEELLVGIWSEVLRREGIGIREDFFGLGGHSLLATQVVSRVREVFRVELPLRRFFETPT
ncbi:MAG TPA: amino acid adenylation domain-containing protein, partial [Thermoanaerobaculia bacterium]|nr:amino acid adenylation domain-containing protein [Thermoanaerobaculia bacterium]